MTRLPRRWAVPIEAGVSITRVSTKNSYKITEMKTTIFLNDVERIELLKDVKGQGGFQGYLRRMRSQFNPTTGELTIYEADLAAILKYAPTGKGGGFQGHLKRIFGRHLTLIINSAAGTTTIGEEKKAPLLEGSIKNVVVNAHERNNNARILCIVHYGAKCSVCKFDFGEVYGDLGDGFIHVHHVVPLSQITETYEVDPVKDLRPVCPNCHAMLHQGDIVLLVDELRQIMDKIEAADKTL